jgi:hypothetical protein
MKISIDCTLHTDILKECIRRYIPKTMEIIPLHPSIIHGVHYIWVYQRNMSVDIFQRPWELCPFTLVLFTVFITYGYTNRMCLSVYSTDHGKWELLPFTLALFNMFITYKYTYRNLFVCIFQRL